MVIKQILCDKCGNISILGNGEKSTGRSGKKIINFTSRRTKMEKHILDATCGSRTIWFDKKCPAAIYFDCREEHGTAIWKSTKNDSVRTLDVVPDVIGDFTALPFDDASFELVVFDPPHLVHIGENAWLRKKYGKLPENWPQLIHDGFWECMRVLKPHGTLIFKWNEFDIPTREIIKAIGKDPLFGHRSGKAMKTHWLCFMKGV